MKKHKKLIKAFLIVIIVGIFGLLSAYEVGSIIRKEYHRQNEIFGSSRETINHMLDKIKVAVITRKPDEYKDSLGAIMIETVRIKRLSFIASEKADYTERLDNYIKLLDTNVSALEEMQALSEEINTITNKLNELYKDEGGITKERVRSAKDDIKALMINTEKYNDERIISIVETVNKLLDSLSSGANGLAECIDECYEDRFNTLSDELSDKLKESVDSLPALNLEYEKIFQFDTLKNIQKEEEA